MRIRRTRRHSRAPEWRVHLPQVRMNLCIPAGRSSSDGKLTLAAEQQTRLAAPGDGSAEHPLRGSVEKKNGKKTLIGLIRRLG